ncbi:hypothetical protein BHM03_00055796 [Ensete ventricosum]|nr:hypothetical protein BHM03_00055796 [Ensete ventricosum]
MSSVKESDSFHASTRKGTIRKLPFRSYPTSELTWLPQDPSDESKKEKKKKNKIFFFNA